MTWQGPHYSRAAVSFPQDPPPAPEPTPPPEVATESVVVAPPSLPYATRYPWYTRWFIIAAVFFIVSRSAFNVRMHKVDWAKELSMYTLPYALPTSKEREEIRAGKSKRYPTLEKRFDASYGSFLRFANPVPQQKTLDKIESNLDWLKYAAVWLHSRMEFVGRIVGVEERWTMYSPTVGKVRTVVRAVLRYEDGTTTEARARTEPRDLANYFRPFAQRRLQFDINLPNMEGVRLGWARYLSRHHGTNAEGSPLKTIDMYKVSYKLPDPGADYGKHWRSGNGRRVKGDPFWRFDVARNKGQSLEKKKDEKKKGPAKPSTKSATTPPSAAPRAGEPSTGTSSTEARP